jgi:hypothetical protein
MAQNQTGSEHSIIIEQMRLTLSKPQEMRKLNFSTYNGCTNWVSGSIQAPNPE